MPFIKRTKYGSFFCIKNNLLNHYVIGDNNEKNHFIFSNIIIDICFY